MARKNNTQPHPPSQRPPVKGDNGGHAPSEFLGITTSPTHSDLHHVLPLMTAGSPAISTIPTHAAEENNDPGAIMNVALNRNVHVSVSGSGWIIGAGMAVIRLMAKISGHGVTMSLSRGNGRRGPSDSA